MSTPVSTILKNKEPGYYSVDCEATVFEAVKNMVEKKVGAMLVTDKDLICGIITERDYLRRVTVEDRTSKDTKVKEIMTKDVIVVDPDDSAEECLAVMTKVRCRHLPVVDKGKIAGVVSIGDLVKQISQDREFKIKHLTDYITGKYPG